MKYSNDFVDEQYASILEPNLFADTVLFPGITYNDSIVSGDPKAGLVHIYKETAAAQADPSTPAGKFVDTDTANSLIDLRLNNSYRKSKDIYQVTINSCGYAKAEENLALAVTENKRDRQASALACLAQEGTIVTGEALSTTNIKSKIVSTRASLRKAHAKPTIVFANVDTFGLMLEVAGTQYTPTTNERILSTGQVGNYLGMTWFEVDAMEGTAKYYDNAGILQTVVLDNVDFIMYDASTFHIKDNLNAMRLMDTTEFTGVKAQNEINTGFRVSNADKVAVYTTELSL